MSSNIKHHEIRIMAVEQDGRLSQFEVAISRSHEKATAHLAGLFEKKLVSMYFPFSQEIQEDVATFEPHDQSRRNIVEIVKTFVGAWH